MYDFYYHGAIELPEEIQLELLKLDFTGYAQDHHAGEPRKKLFELVYEKTDPVKFKAKILETLKEGIVSRRVLTTLVLSVPCTNMKKGSLIC